MRVRGLHVSLFGKRFPFQTKHFLLFFVTVVYAQYPLAWCATSPLLTVITIFITVQFVCTCLCVCTQRRYHGQEALPSVAAVLKVAVKAAGEIPQLIFTSADLKGPHGSSRLLPLFEALQETGYPALREVFFWNTLIENNDVLVLANYLERKRPDQNLTVSNNRYDATCATLPS